MSFDYAEAEARHWHPATGSWLNPASQNIAADCSLEAVTDFQMNSLFSENYVSPSTWFFPTAAEYPRSALSSRASRNLHHYLQLENGRLVYTAPGETSESTTAAIRTKEPIPKDCPVYAYEVEVIHAHGPPTPSRIAIGIQYTEHIITRMPGIERLSLAVHGDSGLVYSGGGAEGEPYLSFTKGDTVCVLVNRIDETISFYKNGLSCGAALVGLPTGAMYPCIGFELCDAIVCVNLGKEQFRYDVLSTAKEDVRAQLMSNICRAPLVPQASAHLVSAVMDHLVHTCCPLTAQAVAAAAAAKQDGSILPGQAYVSQNEVESMAKRRCLAELLLKGRICDAMALVEEVAPGMLQQRSDIRFQLNLQHFIELMRIAASQQDCLAAMRFARDQLKRDCSTKHDEEMREALLLLATTSAHDSPSVYLFDQERRSRLSCNVHAALMQWQGKEQHSKLEQLLRHVHAVRDCMTEEGLVAGQLLSVQEVVNGGAHILTALHPVQQGVAPKPL